MPDKIENLQQQDHIELFAIRSKDGKWFRRKGYEGYGQTWVDTLKTARIYSRSGPARSVITFFKEKWPGYGTPDLIKFVVTTMVVVDETERNAKAQKRKETAAARSQLREQHELLKNAQQTIAEAALLKAEAEATIKRLGGKVKNV